MYSAGIPDSRPMNSTDCVMWEGFPFMGRVSERKGLLDLGNACRVEARI